MRSPIRTLSSSPTYWLLIHERCAETIVHGSGSWHLAWLVHHWCEKATSKTLEVRRKAYARLEAATYDEPSYWAAETLLGRAIGDPDEQIRLSAAKAVLHTGSPERVGQVFEQALRNAADARNSRGRTAALCYVATPRRRTIEGNHIIKLSKRSSGSGYHEQLGVRPTPLRCEWPGYPFERGHTAGDDAADVAPAVNLG